MSSNRKHTASSQHYITLHNQHRKKLWLQYNYYTLCDYKNSISAQPSTIKKIFFVSGYVPTGVHRTKKISLALLSLKTNIFSFLLSILLHETSKNFIRHSISTEKIIISDYSMVHGTLTKCNQIRTSPKRTGYSTTMVRGT